MIEYIIYLISAFLLGTFWHIPALALYLTQYKIHKTRDGTIIQQIKNKTKVGSYYEESKVNGLILGKYYIGFLDEGGNYNSLIIFCSTPTWERLTKVDFVVTDNNKKPPVILTIVDVRGSFTGTYTTARKINASKFKARSNQKTIVKDIISHYNENKQCVAYIYGEPGSGKSVLSVLLSKKLKGPLCFSWNPTHPGRSLSVIYTRANPTEIKPLILLLDEIDTIWDKFPIAQHKEVPTEVTDKASWNLLLDQIDNGLYPYTILIMTSNKDCSSYDESYTREGRVNIKKRITSINQ